MASVATGSTYFPMRIAVNGGNVGLTEARNLCETVHEAFRRGAIAVHRRREVVEENNVEQKRADA
jgi:hypothetical protein